MKNRGILKKSFTLIELLVVIAIIGILAAMIIVQISSARKKARDVQRKSDMSQINKLVQIYYLDNSKFPYTPNPNPGPVNCPVAGCTTDRLEKILKDAGYTSIVPSDPINNSIYQYKYRRTLSGGVPIAYTLFFQLENQNEQVTTTLWCKGEIIGATTYSGTTGVISETAGGVTTKYYQFCPG